MGNQLFAPCVSLTTHVKNTISVVAGLAPARNETVKWLITGLFYSQQNQRNIGIVASDRGKPHKR